MWYYWLHKSHAIHVTFRLLAILHPIGGHFSLSCYGCNKAIALSICSLRLFSSFSLLFLQSPLFLQSRLFFHSPFFLQASLFQLPLCLCSADDSTPATMLEWEWLYRVKRCLLTVWYHTSIQFLIKSSSSFLLLCIWLAVEELFQFILFISFSRRQETAIPSHRWKETPCLW